MHSPRKFSPWLIFLIYLAFTVLMTWPLAARLGTHIPGSEGDAWVHFWTFQWVRDQLLSGGDIFYTNLIYYPNGTSLIYHNFAWLHIGLWLPLQALVGEAAAYSLIFMAGFAFTAFTTFLLAREVTGNEAAALLAGLIAGFWPHALSHHNHPNLIFIGFIPLTLLYVRRTFLHKRWRDALIAAVFLALVGITRWQLLVMGGFLMGLYWLAWVLPAWRDRATVLQNAKLSLVIGGVALLVMLPLLSPLLISQTTAESASVDSLSAGEQRTGQTDLLAYLTPSRYHPLWGDTAFKLTENYTVNKVFTPYLGLTTLLLAVFGLVKRWRAARFWGLVAAVYIILSLGGILQINGEFYFPLPYLLLEETFIGTLIRRSDRLNVFLGIPMGLLAAHGFLALREQIGTRWRVWLTAAIAALILFEYVVEYRTFALETPAWHQALASESADFAILDLPMHRRDYDEHYMFYQLTHGRPLVGGHVSRPPEAAFAFINTVPFLRDFRVDREPIPEITNVGGQLRPLAEANVPYLVLHKKFLPADKLTLWKDWLALKPVHEDDEVVVYHTDLKEGRDFVIERPLLEGVGVIESTVFPAATTQEGWVDIEVVWGSTRPLTADYEVCLAWTAADGELNQSDCQPISQTWPTSQWAVPEVLRASYRVQASPYLESGSYLLMASLQKDGRQVGQTAALGMIDFTAVARSFELPNPEVKTGLNWDGRFSLLGYELNAENRDQLRLDLYWQAEMRMQSSYVIFVHLIDTNTGELAAQADAAPRGWSYPTNWWEAGEIVADQVALDLAEVPAGEYTIFLGAYHAETQDRLPVASPEGDTFADAAVPLTIFQR